MLHSSQFCIHKEWDKKKKRRAERSLCGGMAFLSDRLCFFCSTNNYYFLRK